MKQYKVVLLDGRIFTVKIKATWFKNGDTFSDGIRKFVFKNNTLIEFKQ